MKLMKIINWQTISFFGKSPVINRSYIYLFLVPALAKILSKINSPIKFFIGDSVYSLHLTLPFSWKLFFFSALLFSLGALLYSIAAPAIVKDYKSYGEFLVDKKNFNHIFAYRDDIGVTNAYFNKIGVNVNNLKNKSLLEDEIEILKPGSLFFNRKRAIEKMELSYIINNNWSVGRHSQDSEGLELSFWAVYDFAKNSRPVLLILTSLFYITGFIMITIVFIQSIILVFQL